MVNNRQPSRKIAICLAATVGLACALTAPVLSATGWDPDSFRSENTLDFLTVGPDEGEHWSRVWLVVIDHQLYVRLGPRAAGRIEGNTSAPFVKVRIADQQFDRVRVEPAPDTRDAVGAEMANKYWTDLIIRHFSHPLIARLTAEPPAHSP
jgi:hypothetical protein